VPFLTNFDGIIKNDELSDEITEKEISAEELKSS
jgi:hypothetical protein